MSELPFEPACFFEDCDGIVDGIMGAYVKFKSHGEPEAFLCERHLARANELDQITTVWLVMTGIDKIIKRYDEGLGLV